MATTMHSPSESFPSSASARSLVNVAMPHCRGKWLPTSATLRLIVRVMVDSSQQGIRRTPLSQNAPPLRRSRFMGNHIGPFLTPAPAQSLLRVDGELARGEGRHLRPRAGTRSSSGRALRSVPTPCRVTAQFIREIARFRWRCRWPHQGFDTRWTRHSRGRAYN